MQSSVNSISLVTHALALSSVLALVGCESNPPVVAPQLNASVAGAQTQGSKSAPFFVVRAGDSVLTALRSLGLIEKKTYILAEKSIEVLPGVSAPIYGVTDLAQYFEAYGYTLNLTSPVGTNYMRVMVAKTQSAAKAKAHKNCKVNILGSVPMGPVISDIADQAGIEVNYADTGATAYAGVVYPVNYKGPCSNALEYLGRKSDLTVSFNEDSVEYRMMDTAAIDIGVPLQERKITMDILASGGGAATAGSSGSSSGAAGGGGGGAKSMQSTYVTNYAASIKSILESTKTPFGTWHYVPETGQVFIRDRADAVAVAKASINRMAQAFQSRFEITLTLYRMTVSKDRQINGSLSGVINQSLALNFGLPNALPKSVGGAVWTDGVSGTKSAFQVLSEWGAIETLDSYSLTLQAGIPQTMKVANNTEYVRNISSTTTGTTGAVTSTIEQANATDGSFITMQARQTEAGKIAVDYGVFINRLDGFDTTQTQSSVVKSQRGFERTFDTMAVVDDGIPYIASVVSQKSRTDKISTLPGLEDVSGAAGLLVPLLAGNRGDASAQTYIVVMVEAKRQ